MNTFNFENLTKELVPGTNELLPMLGITDCKSAPEIVAIKSDAEIGIEFKDSKVYITYNKPVHFFRMLSMSDMTIFTPCIILPPRTSED